MEFSQQQRLLAASIRANAKQQAPDTSDEFCLAVLQLIVGEVLDYANQWCDSSKLEQAIQELEMVVHSKDHAYQIAREIHDLVSAQVCAHLPHFGEHLRLGYYAYEYFGGLNAKVKISYHVSADVALR